MSEPSDEARVALQKARAALRNGQFNQARQWAEQAAALAPHMEDPWLVLAAVASPPASLEYVKKALKINPQSAPARRAMEWALDRLRQPDRSSAAPASTATAVPRKHPIRAEAPAVPPATEPARPRWHWPPRPRRAAMLVGLGCIVFAAAAWATGLIPAAASLVQNAISGTTQPIHWAPVSIPKPTYTPQPPSSQGSAGLVASTVVTAGDAWIDLNVAHQTMHAYGASILANPFLASSGALLIPTTTGA